jgi:ATPase subunit of ABC transporter with duplicated ATPase domains
VLDNVNLSFYPDAKIGVLGPTARASRRCSRSWPASTRNITGEAWVAHGATVGYLSQEPQLDEPPRLGSRERHGGRRQARRRSSTATTNWPMNYSDETADEMAKLQDEIDAQNLWDLDSKVDQAMDALRCPPDDAAVDQAVGRRTPPRRAVPLLLLDQPDLLLLDEPTNHLDAESVHWLETICATIPARS